MNHLCGYDKLEIMVTTVLIDFFGVIHLDTLNSWLTHHAANLHTQAQNIGHAADLGEISGEDFFANIGSLTNDDIETVRAEFECYEGVNQPVVELLKRLQAADYTIGLISNSSVEYVERLIRKYQLRPLFDHVIVSANLGIAKPAAGIYERALQVCEARAEEAVFIDDRQENADGATRVGITGLKFTSTTELERDLRELGLEF